MIPAEQMNREITLRTIAAAWRCTYTVAAQDAPYAGILTRGGKPVALVYIEQSRETGAVVDLPETLDAISLQRGNASALETGVAAAYAVQMSETVAVLVRKGEPINYSMEIHEARLVAVIPPTAWKFLPLPAGTRWSTAKKGEPG